MSVIRTHGVVLCGGDGAHRMVLRPLSDGHLPLLYRWNADPEVLYWTEGEAGLSYSPEVVDGIYGSISQNNLCFAVEADGETIGECWLQRIEWERMGLESARALYPPDADVRRIDMCIGEKAWWGRGIGTLLVRTLTDYAFRAEKVDALHCICEDYNVRSCRVWEKNGFRPVQVVQLPEGRLGREQRHYALTREQYAAKTTGL